MMVEIRGILDRGVANKERLHLTALREGDLQFILVAETLETVPGKIMTGWRSAYWFPPTPVQAGDHILLCTGPGTNTKRQGSYGTVHFFYWGISKTLWNSPLSRAVVFEVSAWDTAKPAQ